MTVRQKSYFFALPPKDLVQQLLVNTGEAVNIRAAINDHLVQTGSPSLYDWIRADVLATAAISSIELVNKDPCIETTRPEPRSNGLPTGIDVGRMKTTKEVAFACIRTGFDATKWPKLYAPDRINFYIIEASEMDGDGEMISDLTGQALGLWRTIKAALVEHISSLRRG